MSKKTITYEVDMNNPPPLSEQEKVELKALAALPDEDIDTSDISPLTEEFWKVAERGKFYKPLKKQITVRVDADVLAWLKSSGNGYQTRMNDILRQAMLKKSMQ